MNQALEKNPNIDWATIGETLSFSGYALTGQLLSPTQCQDLISLYSDDTKRADTTACIRTCMVKLHFRCNW
jgi:hypothetical protein